MKKVYNDKIINIENTDLFDNRFLFDKLDWEEGKHEVEIIYLSDLLEKKKNKQLLDDVKNKPAMWSRVYSAEAELKIFKELFESAIKNNKKIHIVGVTLDEEIKILEEYYKGLGFLRDDINCFAADFSVPFVTVSIKIENIVWRGSDYKAMREKIFFNPPIRESGQVKALFKGINRGVIAGIYIENYSDLVKDFIEKEMNNEHILPLTLAKTLCYNLEEIGFSGDKKELIINY